MGSHLTAPSPRAALNSLAPRVTQGTSRIGLFKNSHVSKKSRRYRYPRGPRDQQHAHPASTEHGLQRPGVTRDLIWKLSNGYRERLWEVIHDSYTTSGNTIGIDWPKGSADYRHMKPHSLCFDGGSMAAPFGPFMQRRFTRPRRPPSPSRLTRGIAAGFSSPARARAASRSITSSEVSRAAAPPRSALPRR
jgi:hypothetical protein